jgi:hypothetical protein
VSATARRRVQVHTLRRGHHADDSSESSVPARARGNGFLRRASRRPLRGRALRALDCRSRGAGLAGKSGRQNFLSTRGENPLELSPRPIHILGSGALLEDQVPQGTQNKQRHRHVSPDRGGVSARVRRVGDRVLAVVLGKSIAELSSRSLCRPTGFKRDYGEGTTKRCSKAKAG